MMNLGLKKVYFLWAGGGGGWGWGGERSGISQGSSPGWWWWWWWVGGVVEGVVVLVVLSGIELGHRLWV
jgi:hypothetical protein